MDLLAEELLPCVPGLGEVAPRGVVLPAFERPQSPVDSEWWRRMVGIGPLTRFESPTPTPAAIFTRLLLVLVEGERLGERREVRGGLSVVAWSPSPR